ncbi:MAG: patatin-like phospholipase family protein [Candidatus Methylomirabilaceae bacterium]
MNAFVLSGGANLGSIQAGMLEALFEQGITPDVLVGTSIGAANAAFIAADPSLKQAEALSGLWRRVRPRDVFPWNPIAVARAIFGRGSLFPPEPWRRFLERNIPYRLIEEAKAPLRIVATRFADGEVVVFERGPVVDAVLASTALPGAFPPHRIGEHDYLDGGLTDLIPMGPACEAGVDTIYILSVGFPCPPPLGERSPRAVFMHSVGLMLSQRVRLDSVHYPSEHPDLRIVQIPPVCTQVGLRDFSRSAALIRKAREQTTRFLAGEECIDCEHPKATDTRLHAEVVIPKVTKPE